MSDPELYTLRDGRTLAYTEYGEKTEYPVFYLHGYPGSRLEAALVMEFHPDQKLRLISIDRPGLGYSEYQGERRITDLPDDIMELAEHLGLKRYGVLGMSGGGPYALACAHRIPSEALSGCVAVSGTPPYYQNQDGLRQGEKTLLYLARSLPGVFSFLLWLQIGRNIHRQEWWDRDFPRKMEEAPEPDRLLYKDERVKAHTKAKSLEGFRQGSRGIVHEFTLYAKDWGFRLEDISPEVEVDFFYGGLDYKSPRSVVEDIHKRVPNSVLHFYEDEGHLSVLLNKWDEIVTTLNKNQ